MDNKKREDAVKDRRDFLKVVGISAGAAATVACDPPDKLVPYVIQPEAITPGIAVDYASTCQECPVGCGLIPWAHLATSHPAASGQG